MKPIIAGLALVAGLVLNGPAGAQSVLEVTDDTKVVVQLDFQAFRGSDFGRQLLDHLETMAQRQLAEDGVNVMSKFTDALGFDPLQEIDSLTIVADDFEHPEQDMRAILRLGDTTGNLEGLMLALPGYSSESEAGYTIHSASDDGTRVYIAIHTGRRGQKSVVAASSKDELMRLLDSLDSNRGRRRLGSSLPDDLFLRVRVLGIPDQLSDDPSFATAASIVKDVELLVGEVDDELVLNLSLSAVDEQRAEQVRQLVQGIVALVSLAELGADTEKELALARDLFAGIVVERDDDKVTLEIGVPQSLILDAIAEETEKLGR